MRILDVRNSLRLVTAPWDACRSADALTEPVTRGTPYVAARLLQAWEPDAAEGQRAKPRKERKELTVSVLEDSLQRIRCVR